MIHILYIYYQQKNRRVSGASQNHNSPQLSNNRHVSQGETYSVNKNYIKDDYIHTYIYIYSTCNVLGNRYKTCFIYIYIYWENSTYQHYIGSDTDNSTYQHQKGSDTDNSTYQHQKGRH